MKKILLALALGIFFSGCATSYQKDSFSGGFSETQLSENVWKVHFRGNGKTTMERATDFCLLRSAELTLENGYQYFAIINEDSSTKSSTFTSPQTAYTNAYGYTTFSGGQTFTANKPRTQNTILMFKEKTDKAGMVYEAQFIVQSLRGKYSREFQNK
jgi:hypothetical protein